MEALPVPDSRAHLRELFSNQVWQSLNFVSKAAFLVLLTPLMLAKWGAEGYGLFALSASLLVSMALLDGGVRALTRIRMAEALKRGEGAAFRRAFGEGLVTFTSVVGFAVLLATMLLCGGGPAAWFHLPAGGSLVLAVTVATTGLIMIASLLLEPQAAMGNLSLQKAANTWGALLAMPACGLAVWLGASVLTTVVIYAVCGLLPNLVLAVRHGSFSLLPWGERHLLHPRVVFGTLRSGLWYYLTTVALIVRTHALTFVVSALTGPAEAGLFYILLRLTEIVGSVGATASETSLASLAAATEEERGRRFRQSWLYVSVFCGHGAIGLALLGESLLRKWLPGDHQIVNGLGVAMAVFGTAAAVSRVAVNAAMGLGAARSAALGNLAEAALDVALAVVGYKVGGLPGLLVGGSLGLVAMVPATRRVARLCAGSAWLAFIRPLSLLAPGFAAAAVLQGVANIIDHPAAWLTAIALSGGIALLQLRRIHRTPA